MVYGLLAVLGAIVIVFFLPARLWIEYRYRGRGKSSVLIQFRAGGGLYSRTVTAPGLGALDFTAGQKGKQARDSAQGSANIFARIGRLGRLYSRGWRFWRRVVGIFKRSFKIQRFIWRTELGSCENHMLAMAAGALWAFKGAVYATLRNHLSFTAPPVILVLPKFNARCLRVSFSCILKFPLGYAIIAAFFSGFPGVKSNTIRGVNGERKRTSNSGLDENNDGKHQGNGRCQHGNRRRSGGA